MERSQPRRTALGLVPQGATKKPSAEGDPPLHRDTLQSALGEFGLAGVTLVSVDHVWSSMRVRPL
jgi:hypothetical protein